MFQERRDAQKSTPTRWPVDDRLRAAGEALYGDRWQTDLARDLDVDSRRIRQWIAGERRIPPGIWADLAALLRQRQVGIADVLRGIEA